MARPDILRDRRLELNLPQLKVLVFEHLDHLEKDISHAHLQANTAAGEVVPNRDVFNWRGRLYDLAARVGRHVRQKDEALVKKWLNPQMGEVGVDANAGEGFLPFLLAGLTEADTYGVDTSEVQVDTLRRRTEGEFIIPSLIHPIVGSLTNERIRREIINAQRKKGRPIKYITSFAGIHHMVEEGEQRALIEAMDEMLPQDQDARGLIVDVADGTTTADHFVNSVKRYSLTGHNEKWLSEDRLRGELTRGTGLKVNRARIIEDHAMVFRSIEEMEVWSRALHAFPRRYDVIAGLQTDLNGGREFKPDNRGRYLLPWPLLVAELVKK